MDQLRQQMPSRPSVCFRRCQHSRRWGSEVKLAITLPWNMAPASDTRPGHHTWAPDLGTRPGSRDKLLGFVFFCLPSTKDIPSLGKER